MRLLGLLLGWWQGLNRGNVMTDTNKQKPGLFAQFLDAVDKASAIGMVVCWRMNSNRTYGYTIELMNFGKGPETVYLKTGYNLKRLMLDAMRELQRVQLELG